MKKRLGILLVVMVMLCSFANVALADEYESSININNYTNSGNFATTAEGELRVETDARVYVNKDDVVPTTNSNMKQIYKNTAIRSSTGSGESTKTWSAALTHQTDHIFTGLAKSTSYKIQFGNGTMTGYIKGPVWISYKIW